MMEERTLPLLTAAQIRGSYPKERTDLDDLIFQGEHWTISEREKTVSIGDRFLLEFCHCEPVRKLARQSVFLTFRNTDSHGSDIGHCLGMTIKEHRIQKAVFSGCPLQFPALPI